MKALGEIKIYLFYNGECKHVVYNDVFKMMIHIVIVLSIIRKATFLVVKKLRERVQSNTMPYKLASVMSAYFDKILKGIHTHININY